MIIDTHAHLDDERYINDLDEVLANAKANGVEGVLIPGADINDLKKARKIAHENENIYFAAGVHPYHHEQYDEKILREFLEDEKCIAVGECGLDYYRLPESEDEKRRFDEATQRLEVRLKLKEEQRKRFAKESNGRG